MKANSVKNESLNINLRRSITHAREFKTLNLENLNHFNHGLISH